MSEVMLQCEFLTEVGIRQIPVGLGQQTRVVQVHDLESVHYRNVCEQSGSCKGTATGQD